MKLSEFKIGDVIFCAEYSYRPLKIIAIEKSAQGVEYVVHNDVNGMSVYNEMNGGNHWQLYTEPKPEQRFREVTMYKAVNNYMEGEGLESEAHLTKNKPQIDGITIGFIEQKVFLKDDEK